MRTLLLFLAYVLLIAPVGLLLRLFHDPLARRWRPAADSYWTTAVPGGPLDNGSGASPGQRTLPRGLNGITGNSDGGSGPAS